VLDVNNFWWQETNCDVNKTGNVWRRLPATTVAVEKQ